MALLRDAHQLVQGGGNVVNVIVTEVTQAVKVGTVYILTASVDMFIRFSSSTAVAITDGLHDLYMPAGTSAILMSTATLLRAISDGTDGTLGVAEVEIT